MHRAVDSTKQIGARDYQIAVLTSYKGQLMMIQNLGMQNEATTTVDVCKVVLLGDPKQLLPFCLVELTELVHTAGASVMVRMINTGVPVTMLK